jgi:2-C-methyl-D-erythritol 4-phosphate cytidylyltransferase
MTDRQAIGALLLMAGEGLRFGGETPKQFLMLAGKPVYQHTLEVFVRSGLFEKILLVCHPDWMERVREATKGWPQVGVVAGGASRQESSYQGVLALEGCEAVVIHDAVRPFVTEEILRENVEGALRWGAVDTCIPSADTLVYAPGSKAIEAIPKRADFMRGQTPQSFRWDWIVKAHEAAIEKRFTATDDCRLVMELGHKIHVVFGDEANLKITTELDLFIAEQLFRLRMKTSVSSESTDLQGKIFAIVGGQGGIGRAIGQQLEREGAQAISLSRSSSRYLNLLEPKSIQEAFKRLEEELGPLDGLINCAGKLVVKPLEQMSLLEIEEVLEINLKGLILCCQAAKFKNGAHLINIGSSSFTRGRKEMGVYSSAKAGVVNFTQALAEERPDLRIWAVIPQRTDTPMRRDQFPDENRQTLLDPETIAEQVVAILRNRSSTGQLLEIRKQP